MVDFEDFSFLGGFGLGWVHVMDLSRFSFSLFFFYGFWSWSVQSMEFGGYLFSSHEIDQGAFCFSFSGS